MKKAVALILIILPIFLMVFISLAGSIFSVFGTIRVEEILFVDKEGVQLDGDIIMGLNQEYQLHIKVLPEKASDTAVTFYSEENDKEDGAIAVNSDGLITAKRFGTAKVTVRSKDKRVDKSIIIVVSDKEVSGITLSESEVTMKLGTTLKLDATVLPVTAENKKVIWSSSDTSKVRVDQSGNLTAVGETAQDKPVTVTAATARGDFTAECLVSVRDTSEISFVKSGETVPVLPGQNIVVSLQSIDLKDYIMILTNLFDVHDVAFSILSGSRYGTLDGSTLALLEEGRTIKIRAEVTINDTVYSAEAHFIYIQDLNDDRNLMR